MKNNLERYLDISYDITPNEEIFNEQKEKKLNEKSKDDKNIGIFNSCKNLNFYSNLDNPKRFKLSSSKSVNSNHNETETEHNYDSKKISALFEIEEKRHENSEPVSDNDSDNDNIINKKLKRKEIIERNLKDRRITLSNINRDSMIGYRIKLKDRITTHRIKKLGNVYSDFVI